MERGGQVSWSSHLGEVGAGGQVVEGVLQLLPLQETQSVGVRLGAGGQGAAGGGFSVLYSQEDSTAQ